MTRKITYLLLGILILIGIYKFVDYRKSDDCVVRTFESNSWKKGDRLIRGTMVDNLMKDSILIGKAKDEVLLLLGEPTASDTTNPLVYLVDFGKNTGPFGLGGTWLFYLTVQFDTLRNEVTEVRCND